MDSSTSSTTFHPYGQAATLKKTHLAEIGKLSRIPTLQYIYGCIHNNRYRGEVWWMGVTGGTALLIGIIRYASDFPENLNGLFAEIHAYHVDPKWSPLVYILSALSLGLNFMKESYTFEI